MSTFWSVWLAVSPFLAVFGFLCIVSLAVGVALVIIFDATRSYRPSELASDAGHGPIPGDDPDRDLALLCAGQMPPAPEEPAR